MDVLITKLSVAVFSQIAFLSGVSSQKWVYDMGVTKYIFCDISASICNRNTILVSKHIYLGSTNSMGTFSISHLWRPSWNPRWPPSNLCFCQLFYKTLGKSYCVWMVIHKIIIKTDRSHRRTNYIDEKLIFGTLIIFVAKCVRYQVRVVYFRFGQFWLPELTKSTFSPISR